MNDLEAFAKLAIALEPWRHEIVFAGGWAYRLYRQHERAVKPSYSALYTRDADVALPDKEKFDGNIKAALLAAGFQENLTSEFRPPVSKYTLGEEEQAGFYAEFLTTLRGSGRKRGGGDDATAEIAGITAQKLRHLDLLLIEPWEVSLGGDETLSQSLNGLRIPNPVSFIVQKILVHEKRTKEKRPQDVLYIHDTLELFGDQVEVLTTLWKGPIAGTLTERDKAKALEGRREMFSDITDTLRQAATLPTDRKLVPEEMLARCNAVLDEVFE